MMLDLAPIFPVGMPSLGQSMLIRDRHIDVLGMSRSSLTGKTRLFDWDNQRFRYEVSLTILDDTSHQLWKSFFRRVKDSRGLCYFMDPLRTTPQGLMTGTVVVNGASQTEDSLSIDGCTNSLTPWAYAGDYFQLERNMYMILQDANSDGSGNATLKIWPRLRRSPADNAPLNCSNPRGVFRVTEIKGFQEQPVLYDSAGFTLVEEPQ